MPRFFSTLTLFVSLTFLLLPPVNAAEPLIASGNPEAPPIVWEKAGKLTGIGPELISIVLTREGINYTLRPEGSWAKVQDKARTGKIDLIVSAYDNLERRSFMEFSIPYLKSPVVILVMKGEEFPFTSWNDLKGKKGVANTGESFGEKFDNFIKEQLTVTYTPYEKAFEMLTDTSADYMIIDLYPAVIYSKMLLAEDKIAYLGNPATIQHFHVTISKKSPHLGLMPKINELIKQMKEEGLIKKMALDQYTNWNETFKARQRLFDRANVEARKAQVEYDAGARDRGLDRLAEFIQKDLPYMSN